MKRLALILLLFGLFPLLLTGPAVADEVAPEAVDGCMGGAWGGPGCEMLFAQGDAPAPPMPPEVPGHRRRHLEQFRMLKLLELLDLNDQQEVEFLVEFKAMREKQLLLQREREQVVGTLADGLRADSLGEEEINKLIGRIVDLRRDHSAVTESFVERMRTILKAEQLGKLVIFQERFEYELLDQVRSFRERRGPGGGTTGGAGD